MITAFRILKTKRVATAFDGKGASLTGGRWNSVGIPLVYLAESPALAALEILVHIDDSSLLASFSLIPIEFPETCLKVIGEAGCPALPPNWGQIPAPIECAQAGDSWVASEQSLVLRVPSAVVPLGMNYLFNPRHPDFGLLKIGTPQSFPFDQRLLDNLATGVTKSGAAKGSASKP
ncbi:MAG TPA: RES family NAD+ phosphorylase [Abditibacterium sp.]|jgi:RES domain-containing protein